MQHGKLIGKGSFGRCYLDNGLVYKIGKVDREEYDAQLAAWRCGIAPEPISYKAEGNQSVLCMRYVDGYKRASTRRLLNYEVLWLVLAVVKYGQAGWRHGDLHNQNVMVCKGKLPYVIDYGLADEALFDSSIVCSVLNALRHCFGHSKLSDQLIDLAEQYTDSLLDFGNAILLLTATTKLIKADQRDQLLHFWHN